MSEGAIGHFPTQNAPPSMRGHCGQGPPRELDARGGNAAPTDYAPTDPRAAGDGVSARVSSTADRFARMTATALSIAASSGGASCALLSLCPFSRGDGSGYRARIAIERFFRAGAVPAHVSLASRTEARADPRGSRTNQGPLGGWRSNLAKKRTALVDEAFHGRGSLVVNVI